MKTLSQLHLKNYKSHKDTCIKLAPLTILTGMNSSGKSSIIQSLLLLRQTHRRGILHKGLELNDTLVSAGSGHDALHRYADNPQILISLKTEDDRPYAFRFDAEHAETDNFLPLVGDAACAEAEAEQLSLFSKDFQYLSAMRWGGKSTFPSKTYEVKEERQISLTHGKGELVAHFLNEFGGEDTYDYFKNDGTSTLSLMEQAVLWERQVSDNITIDVSRTLDGTGYTVTYGLNLSGKKPLSDLRAENIGFGVSYSLPVIVALLSAKPGALVIVENPEAHIHPEGQAALIYLICLVAQRGVQVIVETHSDHIINGALVGCKKFERTGLGIAKENVAIHYFTIDRNEGASKSTQLDIIDDGKLSYQPNGFFDTIVRDNDYLLFG